MAKYLLFTLFLLVSFVGFGQCPTTAVFSSQAEIDEFSTLYPDCVNFYNLTISGPDIVDLSGLAQIQEIERTLTIENNPLLETLAGWENIEFLPTYTNSANLIIQDNLSLVSLGSNFIASEEMRRIEVRNNTTLSNFEGIGNLSSIRTLYIRGNHSLINLQGLENISELGYLVLNTNNSLESIEGLESVSLVEFNIVGEGDLGFEIISNPVLQSLDGMFAEIPLLQYIYIEDNDSLLNLKGLEMVQIFEGPYIYILENENLEDIADLSSIDFQYTSIFEIKDNPKLNSLSPFSSLTLVDNFFSIENNDSLENLAGFENVVFNTLSQIKIRGNDNLNDITAIKDSELLTNELIIQDNPLLSLCGLPSICNYLNNDGEAAIENNGVYCNDVEAILEACSLGLNSISGVVNFDFNNNGCDISDINVSNTKIEITDGTNLFSTFPDVNGQYMWFVDEGNYNVAIQSQSVPEGIVWSPEETAVNFGGVGETEIVNFCLSTEDEIGNLKITFLPLTLAVPGFDAQYQLIYENVGAKTISGSIALNFEDSKQTFVEALPLPIDVNGNEISWDYVDLLPFQSNTLNITFHNLPPPTNNAGDILSFEASINPFTDDENPEDNTYSFDQIMVSSFDPNDKQVNQGQEIFESEVDNYLDYIVRFQNVGTASAVNIRVDDILSDNLNWNTFRMLSSSHDYRIEILDGNTVSFIFEDIYLPPESSDPEGSNGYIAFQIKPNQTLSVGDEVENTANIYFDFNPPIITNTVITQVVENLSVDDFSLENLIMLHPNPVSSTLQIQTSNSLTFQRATIYSILGKQLVTTSEKQINMEGLSSGIYFVNVKTNKGSLTKKIVKQ